MRFLAPLVLILSIAAIPIGSAGSLAAAQGTPEPLPELLADCPPGRDPSPEEEEQLIAATGKNYLQWEGVCEPLEIVDAAFSQEGAFPPEQLEERIGTELPADLREDLDQALEEAAQENIELVFQPYGVGFREEYAAVPRIEPDPDRGQGPTEFMVVYVRQGSFVFDLQDERVAYVFTTRPEGEFITTEPWTPEAPKPHYTVTGTPLADDAGSPCMNACRVRPDEPVQLLAGDFVIAQRGTVCRYCLEQTASQIEEEGVPVLEVYALMDPQDVPNEFSWVQSWRLIQDNPQLSAIPPTMLGWAIPPLGTGCRDA